MKDTKCLICGDSRKSFMGTQNLYKCRDVVLIIDGFSCESCKTRNEKKQRTPYGFGTIIYNKEVEEVHPEDLQAAEELYNKEVKNGKRSSNRSGV